VAQKTKFARQALNQVEAGIEDLAALRAEITAGQREILKLNKQTTDEALDQKMVRRLMSEMEQVQIAVFQNLSRMEIAEERLRIRIAKDIEPFLERDEPSQSERIAEQGERIAAMEAQMRAILDELRIELPVTDEVKHGRHKVG
jgi:hypothetical protein